MKLLATFTESLGTLRGNAWIWGALTVGTGTTFASESAAPASAGGLGAALTALGDAAPGVGIGIRLVGYDSRTRRLGNAAMNAVLARGRRFDDCDVLAEFRNGRSYERLSVLVDEPAGGLPASERFALVTMGLEVLSHLDDLGAASVAA
ncbi:hypothetical protein [Defluviimonas sp. WL0075]|uniref:Uncharacterized protein n=1 Tax=Albidovulum sediminicola TaxID=2984331 RepID=A0ABT2Z585_9RHOB|nr:hypothetical protein [Defluviimonas sp. WL0075]MCV2866271.1 hypothetical protein [Defluviimonas sp. WL0075]